MLEHEWLSEENAHVVQFYEADEQRLIANVTQSLFDGYEQGAILMVVATKAHRDAFLRALAERGVDTESALKTGQIASLDADMMLRRFLNAGYPDAKKFDQSVGAAIRSATARSHGRGLRVYGEMVGLLWQNGQYPAAIRLEQLWHALRQQVEFTLICGYPIDVFSKDFDPAIVDALLCAHSHLLPTTENRKLRNAVSRAMDEVLGPSRVHTMKAFMNGSFSSKWGKLPPGESMILWLRKMLPEEAEQILSLARGYYTAQTA